MTDVKPGGTRVTATDLSTGESESVVIFNDYVVICDGKYRISSVQRHSNGTVQITLMPNAEVTPRPDVVADGGGAK